MKKRLLVFMLLLVFTITLSASSIAQKYNAQSSIDKISIEKSESILKIIIDGHFKDGFVPLIKLDADNDKGSGDNGYEYAIDSSGALSKWTGTEWCYLDDAVIDLKENKIFISIYLDNLYDPSVYGVANVLVKGIDSDGIEVMPHEEHVEVKGSIDAILTSAEFKSSSVKVINVTETSATVTWETSRRAIGYVKYGKNSSYGKESIKEEDYAKKHVATFSNLKANNTYYFTVVSIAEDGRIVESKRTVFTTPCRYVEEIKTSEIYNVSLSIDTNLFSLSAYGKFYEGFVPVIGINADNDANTGNQGNEYQIDEDGRISRWTIRGWEYVSDLSIEIKDESVSAVAALSDFSQPMLGATIVVTLGGHELSGVTVENVVKTFTWREGDDYLDEQNEEESLNSESDTLDNEVRNDVNLSLGEQWQFVELGDIYASNDIVEETPQWQQEESEELMMAARRGVRLYESYYSGGFRIVDNSSFNTVNTEASRINNFREADSNRIDVLAYGTGFNVVQNAYKFKYKKPYNLLDHIHRSKVYVADYSRGLKLIHVRDKYKRDSSYGINVTAKIIPDIIALMQKSKVYASRFSETLSSEVNTDALKRPAYVHTASAYGLLEEMRKFSQEYSQEVNTIDVESPIALARMMKRIDDRDEVIEEIKDNEKIYAIDYSRGLNIFERQKRRIIYANSIFLNPALTPSAKRYTSDKKYHLYRNKYSFNMV